MASNNKIRIFKRASAIVTGGASGIGRALTEELAERGCEVVLADRQIEMAEEAALKIRTSGGKARALKVDVTDFFAVEQLVQETVERTGRLDYIFNLEMIEKFKPISPNAFAKKALNLVAKNKAIFSKPNWV